MTRKLNGRTFTYYSRRIWFILFVFLFPHFLFAQSTPSTFRRLGTDDGLSGGLARCMIQDTKGFIWIGTYSGLDKYDGYSFKHYSAKPFDSSGLLSEDIHAITEDSSGTIWTGTSTTGLNALNPKSDLMKHYLHDPKNTQSLSSNNILFLFTDSRKRLWVLTSEGLDQFEPVRKTFIHYTISYESEDRYRDDRTSIFEDQKHRIIIQRDYILFYADSLKRTCIPFRIKEKEEKLAIDFVYQGKYECIAKVKAGKGTKLCKIDLFSQKVLVWYCDFPPWFIGDIQPRDSTSYFIGTSSGIYILHTDQKKLEPIPIKVEALPNIQVPMIYSMLIDRNGNLWAGSRNGEVYELEKDHNLFLTNELHVLPERTDALSKIARTLRVTRSGALMAATASGHVLTWDSTQRQFLYSYAVSPFNDVIHPRWIFDILEDKEGNFWHAVANEGPFLLKGKGSKTLNVMFGPSDTVTSPPIAKWGLALYEDRSGNIWCGTYNQSGRENDFLKYDPDSKLTKTFTLSTKRDSDQSNGITCFLEDRSGQFWIGAYKGLYSFDRATEKVVHYQYDSSYAKSHRDDWVKFIYEDRAGNFWLGTDGLVLFDRTMKKFTHFSEERGLQSSHVRAILEAKDGALWISTLSGISRFDPVNKTFVNFGWSDGIRESNFQGLAAGVLPNGEMFFGASDGVTSFFPEQWNSGVVFSPLVITSFNVSGKKRFAELTNADEIELPYNENDFSFEFAALDFNSPLKKRYAYKLEGWDDDWIQAGSHNYAAYNNVRPGRYIFRVKTYNSQGVWDPNEIMVKLSITPPFWETWWFRGLCILFFLVLVALWRRRKVHNNQEFEKNLDEARERERIKIAGELHDGPLQDLYATRFILEGPTEEIGKSSTVALHGLLKKVRSDLRSITGELQIPKFETGFADEIRFFADAFQEKYPELKVEILAQELRFTLTDDAQQNIFRIYRSSMSNIAKHARAKNVAISFVTNEQSISLSIEDDGIGFDNTVVAKGNDGEKHFGMFLNQYYAQTIGAKFQVQSSPGKGTTVTIFYERPRQTLSKLIGLWM